MKKTLLIFSLCVTSLFACRSAKDTIKFEPNSSGPEFTVVQDSLGRTGICEEYGGVISIDTSRTNEVLRKGVFVNTPNFVGGIWLDEHGDIRFFERGCTYLKQ